MNKSEIIKAAKEIRDLLIPRECENPDRLRELVEKYGRIGPIDKMLKDDYDRKVVHSGFGAPNCSCHIAPPCQACIDYTSKEETP